MKKAVFFDIDGTLWDFKMNIPESTKKALKELRKNGYYAFLCSEEAGQILKVPNYLHLDLTESWRHAVHISNLREKSYLNCC